MIYNFWIWEHMIQIMKTYFWKWIWCWKHDSNYGLVWSESPDSNHDLNHSSNIFNFCYLNWVFLSIDLNHILWTWLELNSYFSWFLCPIYNTYINLYLSYITFDKKNCSTFTHSISWAKLCFVWDFLKLHLLPKTINTIGEYEYFSTLEESVSSCCNVIH